jgi:CDGSH-type Zn-finger protein
LSEPIHVVFKRRGTILIEGVVEVRDEEGNLVAQPPAKHEGILKLCGCGRSATRPFCDGSHKQPLSRERGAGSSSQG